MDLLQSWSVELQDNNPGMTILAKTSSSTIATSSTSSLPWSFPVYLRDFFLAITSQRKFH